MAPGFSICRLRAASLALTAATLLLTAACAQILESRYKSSDAATQFFATGYEHIAERYIEPVPIDRLAIDGLKGLETFDPAISVSRTDGLVRLALNDAVVAEFAAPGDSDPEAWASLTVAALKASQVASPSLKGAAVEDLYEAMFDRIMSGLDQHSRYASAEAAQKQRAAREGFGGIGIRLRMTEHAAEVLSVLPDTPAARAGLKIHDRITHIDHTPVAGLTIGQIVKWLRGPIDTRVHLGLRREGQADPLEVWLKRARIVPPSVSYRPDGNIAYIRVMSFNRQTAPNLAQALAKARHEIGEEIQGVILDLRGNPGGLLDQAVDVSDIFLAHGQIVATRGRHPDSFQLYEASDPDLAVGLSLVVLIDGRSASAAEIVAAALQDRGRAVIIGTNSYGKGTVQTVLEMPNDGELVLTWSRIHTPSGYTLHRLGILPNICTSGAVDNAADLIEAVREGRMEMSEMMVRWRSIEFPDDFTIDVLRAACPSESSNPDIDLEVAERLLVDQALYHRVLVLSQPEVATR